MDTANRAVSIITARRAEETAAADIVQWLDWVFIEKQQFIMVVSSCKICPYCISAAYICQHRKYTKWSREIISLFV